MNKKNKNKENKILTTLAVVLFAGQAGYGSGDESMGRNERVGANLQNQESQNGAWPYCFSATTEQENAKLYNEVNELSAELFRQCGRIRKLGDALAEAKADVKRQQVLNETLKQEKKVLNNAYNDEKLKNAQLQREITRLNTTILRQQREIDRLQVQFNVFSSNPA